MLMKHRNIVSAAFLFFLGLFVLKEGIRLGVKVNLQMGPGFFPFVGGVMLAILSIVLFVQSMIEKKTDGQKRPFWSNQHEWISVSITLSAMGTYVLILNHLGFILSASFLLIFLLRVIGRLKWWVAGFGGTTAAAMAYLIFEIWLKTNLPQGILGF